MTADATADDRNRPLTRDESYVLEMVVDDLRLLTDYLSGDGGGWETYGQAVLNRSAINTYTQTRSRPPALVVNPLYVEQWAAERGRPTTQSQVVAALMFMGAVESVTFRPRGESPRSVRRRPGWFRLTSEMHERVLLNRYVPVLSLGRGRVADQSVASLRAAHRATTPKTLAIGAPGIDATVTLLRDYVANGEPPTPLICVSARHAAPLLLRRSGRPTSNSPFSGFVTTRLAISAQGLSSHSAHAGPRLGMRPMVLPSAKLALHKLAEARPRLCQHPEFFRPADSAGSMRTGSAWVTVDLSGLGMDEPPDLIVGAQEYELFLGWLGDQQRRIGRRLTTAQMRAFAAWMGDRPR